MRACWCRRLPCSLCALPPRSLGAVRAPSLWWVAHGRHPVSPLPPHTPQGPLLLAALPAARRWLAGPEGGVGLTGQLLMASGASTRQAGRQAPPRRGSAVERGKQASKQAAEPPPTVASQPPSSSFLRLPWCASHPLCLCSGGSVGSSVCVSVCVCRLRRCHA